MDVCVDNRFEVSRSYTFTGFRLILSFLFNSQVPNSVGIDFEICRHGLFSISGQITNQRQIIVNLFGFTVLQTTLLGIVDGIVSLLVKLKRIIKN